MKNVGDFGTAERTVEGDYTATMKQRDLQALKGFNMNPTGFS